jgi:hypothetical protein
MEVGMTIKPLPNIALVKYNWVEPRSLQSRPLPSPEGELRMDVNPAFEPVCCGYHHTRTLRHHRGSLPDPACAGNEERI